MPPQLAQSTPAPWAAAHNAWDLVAHNPDGTLKASAADPPGTAGALVIAHEADTTAIHGIADTSLLETIAGAQAKANAAQAAAIAASQPLLGFAPVNKAGDTMSGNLLISTALSSTQFALINEGGTNAAFIASGYAAGPNGFGTTLYQHARGTVAAPLRAKSGDIIGRLAASGARAADDVSAATFPGSGRARIDFFASEDQTTAAAGTYIVIATCSIGSITPTNRIQIPNANDRIELMTDVEFTDAKNIVFGTTTGTKFGTATNQKWATHGATPVIQRAGAAQAAVATTGATNSAPYGFTTAAQADALVTLVNEIRAMAVEKGFMKGSA